MDWAADPALQAPADGATISYPAEPLELKWDVVPGASKYLVKVATDPELGSLALGRRPDRDGGDAVHAQRADRSRHVLLGDRPAGRRGPRGRAPPRSGPSLGVAVRDRPDVTDLVAAPEVFDPQFSWDPVPGAAGYDVEINFSSDWNESSKVCCTPIKAQIDTLGHRASPADVVLANNTYYWRVRAIDAGNNAGVWNDGPTFTKTFDNVPPVTAPSIKNLRMRDNVADPANDSDGGTAVVDTDVPIVTWDAVPGASSYKVMVTDYAGGVCDWADPDRWEKETSTTAWTPLGWSRGGGNPWPTSVSISTDGSTDMVAGAEYCVRVHAIDRPSDGDIDGVVVGDWSYLPANNQPAFKWNGPPASAACSPCTMSGSDYGAPLTGATVGFMPLFTWDPIPGVRELLRARRARPELHERRRLRVHADPGVRAAALQRVVDRLRGRDDALLLGRPPGRHRYRQRRLRRPARRAARRASRSSRRPADARQPDLVGGRRTRPQRSSTGSPSTARQNYRIQVSQNAAFSGTLLTNAAHRRDLVHEQHDVPGGHGPLLARPGRGRGRAGQRRLAHVVDARDVHQAAAEAGPRPDQSDQRRLPADGQWSPVPGAISYDLRLVEPDGDLTDLHEDPGRRGRVHEDDGRRRSSAGRCGRTSRPARSTPTPGPYSLSGTFNHTLPEPANPAEETGVARLLLTWDPRPRADEYRVQISTRADFATTVESTTHADDRLRPAPDEHRLHGRRHVLLARRHDRRRREPRRLHGRPLVHAPGDPDPGRRRRRADDPDVQGHLRRLPGAEQGQDDHPDRPQRRRSRPSPERASGSRAPASRRSRRRRTPSARSPSRCERSAIRARSRSGSRRAASRPPPRQDGQADLRAAAATRGGDDRDLDPRPRRERRDLDGRPGRVRLATGGSRRPRSSPGSPAGR